MAQQKVLEQLTDALFAEFERTGEPPAFNIADLRAQIEAGLSVAPLVPPQDTIVIRALTNKYATSYGRITEMTVKQLLRLGQKVVVIPLDHPPDDFPEVPIAQEVHGNTWELLIAHPQVWPTPGVATVYFTMWESSRLPPESTPMLNAAHTVIVPSEWNQIVFDANGVDRPLVKVPLGVDTEVFRPKCEPPAIYTFGTAGNDHLRKNIRGVYEAFMRAFPDEENVRLKIKVWPGQDEAFEFGDPRVEICAEQFTDEQMADWYNSLSCYVSASYCEGFGLMPLEAAACGKPIIAVPAHGHAEFMSGGVRYDLIRSPAVAHNPYSGGLWYAPLMHLLCGSMKDYHSLSMSCKFIHDFLFLSMPVCDDRFFATEYGVRLLDILTHIGLVGDDPVEVQIGPKPQPVFRWLARAGEKKIAVVGPEPEACGVGQYGRQVAAALGCSYFPYGDEARLPAQVIFQYHPHYVQQEGGSDYLRYVIENRKVTLDIHNPDRLEEYAAGVHGAVYHSRGFEHVVQGLIERATWLPLMSPLMPVDGQARPVPQTRYLIGWHGLWIPHKGVEILIDAVSFLRMQGLDVGLVALGAIHAVSDDSNMVSVNYWNRCNEAVARLGLDQEVFLCDQMLDYATIRATLEKCDVLCLPYRQVGFFDQSSAAATCVTLGKPLVVSNAAMFEDFRQVAVTVCGENAMDWADMLDHLLRADAERARYAQRSKLAAWERSATVMREKYREVAK